MNITLAPFVVGLLFAHVPEQIVLAAQILRTYNYLLACEKEVAIHSRGGFCV